MVNPATDLPERWLTDWDRSDRMPFYTRANAGEVLPDPASPLGWTLVFEEGLLPGCAFPCTRICRCGRTWNSSQGSMACAMHEAPRAT